MHIEESVDCVPNDVFLARILPQMEKQRWFGVVHLLVGCYAWHILTRTKVNSLKKHSILPAAQEELLANDLNVTCCLAEQFFPMQRETWPYWAHSARMTQGLGSEFFSEGAKDERVSKALPSLSYHNYIPLLYYIPHPYCWSTSSNVPYTRHTWRPSFHRHGSRISAWKYKWKPGRNCNVDWEVNRW